MSLCCCEIPLFHVLKEYVYRRTSPTVVHFIVSINDFPFIMWLGNFHHLFPWNFRIFGFLQESWVIFKSNKLIRKLRLETSIIHLFHVPGPICFHVSHTKVPLTKRKFAVPPLNMMNLMMPRPSTKGAAHKGWGKGWGCYLWMRGGSIHRENAGTLGWYPSCLSPTRRPLEGDIPNRYPLYKVYMGLIIKRSIPRVPPFSPWSMRCDSQWFIACPAKPELQH